MKDKKFDLSLKIGAKKLHLQRKGMYQAIHKYNKLFKTKKGLIKNKYLEKRNCPLCKSKKNNFLFYKNGGRYVKCQSCSLIFLNPSFTDYHLAKYYENMHDAQSKVIAKELIFYNRIYSYGLTAILKNISKKTKSILDIGCSSGVFLNLAQKKGFKTNGVELKKKEMVIAQKRHKIFSKDFLTIANTINEKFDVVTMWDVIEHIKDCHEMLKNIYIILKKDGLFFFQTPNTFSLAARIIQEKCNVFDGIGHVNLFNHKNIALLAKKNSFKIIHIKSVISEIPITNNYLNYDDPYFGNNKQKKIIDLIDEKKLHKNFLGYKIQVIFRKI